MSRFDPLAVDIAALLMALGIDAKRKGDVWVSQCPSGRHVDAHPSWRMNEANGSPKHGTHHCFSCGFGGTATELVMHAKDFLSKEAARDWIIERAMGQINPVWNVSVAIKPLRYTGFALPEGVFSGPLETWMKVPRDYVLSRGVTQEQVAKHQIGYSITGFLNGRIVFPTHDTRGRVVNYTARTFVESPKRYITPRREEGPDFNVVYGERWWPESGSRGDLILTEGVLNKLAIDRVTETPSGCLNGSNPSLGQISRLSTFKRVFILTDQDYAGDKADHELTDALTRHVDILRIRLPTRCGACQHELDEHVKPLGCRCCQCKKWVKQDPNSMRASMLAEALREHGL